MTIQSNPGRISRKAFLGMTGASAAVLLLGEGPLHSFGARAALGQMSRTTGYGPLVVKTAQNDPTVTLRLPEAFNFVLLDRQGLPMDDGNPTPGIFDGTGTYEGRNDDETILIRNTENRRSAGEIPVIVPPELRYDPDPTYNAGDVKLIVRRRRAGRNPDGSRRYEYTIERKFAILGGTDTNCAGGVIGDQWYTCEEVVNRSPVSGLKHGYNFAIPAYANRPVKAVALPQQGRMAHEAVAELGGILYETEDRSIQADPLSPDPRADKKRSGAVLYRFVPSDGDDDDDDDRGRGRGFEGRGKLQGLKLVDEFHAELTNQGAPDQNRVVGKPYRIEWVDVPVPDHNDDTDNNFTRASLETTPTRIQAQDRGAAFFQRTEGIWTETGNIDGDDGDDDDRSRGKVYFDCTSGGAARSGQLWELDPRRRTLTLIFESPGPQVLDGPDNVVIVPRTGDIFLQEDAGSEQFVRGVTPEGELFDFAATTDNDTEFCGGCFDEDGLTFFVSQQGERSGGNAAGTPNANPEGVATGRAVTYAIYGPFEDRQDGGDDDDDDGDDD